LLPGSRHGGAGNATRVHLRTISFALFVPMKSPCPSCPL
jgi:hypothetical protein